MHLCQGQYTQKTGLTPKDAGGGPRGGGSSKGTQLVGVTLALTLPLTLPTMKEVPLLQDLR